MKTSKLLIIATAAVLSVGGILVFNARAERRVQQWEAGLGAKIAQRVKEKLNLSEDQIAQIKDVLKSERDSVAELLKQLHAAHKELRATIRNPDSDDNAIRGAASKFAAVQADLAIERAKLFRKINPILTEEQRKQVSQFHDKVDDFLDNVINRIGERLGE